MSDTNETTVTEDTCGDCFFSDVSHTIPDNHFGLPGELLECGYYPPHDNEERPKVLKNRKACSQFKRKSTELEYCLNCEYCKETGHPPNSVSCVLHAPNYKGYPMTFPHMWCGDYKLDPKKMIDLKKES